MLRQLSLAAVAAISASVCAQTIVTVPQGYGTKEGTNSRHVPLRYTPARIQAGFGAKATGWTKPMVIKELWARADGAKFLTTAFTIDCEVLLSSNGCDPETKAYAWAKNHGADKKVFMKRKSMSFQPFTAAPKPAPFSIQLKGDAPFVAIKPTLLVDWKTYSKSNEIHNNFYIDAARVSGTSTGTRGKNLYFGKPCNPTNFYNYVTGYNVGEVFRPYVYPKGIGDFIIHWIGSKQTNIPIPGQTGCTLYTTPIVFHPSIPKATNTSSLYFSWGTVPATMKGASVVTQFAAVDSTLTQMRWSRGIQTTFGDYKLNYPYTISHRYAYGSGTQTFDPDKDPATYGWVNTAPIFQVK
ncbi:MAG: hypothetical protein CSA62_03705 [Planctomycetota bacterium]|nr:MAG: hypothetical protein CSA62_03705 [Planctomycetota bacterium]